MKRLLDRISVDNSQWILDPFVCHRQRSVAVDLLRVKAVRGVLRTPWLMFILTQINVGVLLFVLACTAYGAWRSGSSLSEVSRNPGMLVTWVIWFPLLPVSALALGRVWCAVCPIAGLGDWIAKIKKFGRPVPAVLKRLDYWLAAATFVLVDYLQERFGIAQKPLFTAVFLLVMVGLACTFSIIFERRTLCRFVCPLAGMLGVYSTMSALELRGKPEMCRTGCREHLCYKGDSQTAGCPTFCHPGLRPSNSACTLCTNCLRSCDNNGLELLLGAPLRGLWKSPESTASLSVIAVVMIGLMAKHQLWALGTWDHLQDAYKWSAPLTSGIAFLACVAGAAIPFALSAKVSAIYAHEKLAKNMARFGIAYAPLALAGHLSHLADDVANVGLGDVLTYIRRLLGGLYGQALVGRGWMDALLTLKLMLIVAGLLGSLISLVMLARKATDRHVSRRALPHVAVLVAFFVAYVFIFSGSRTTHADPINTQPAPVARPRC